MPRDTKVIDRFVAKDPERAKIRQVVENAGFSVERIISPEEGLESNARPRLRRPGERTQMSDRCWAFVLRAGHGLQELFGRRMEVLLFFSAYPTVQARTIHEARAIIEDYRPRLSEDFALLVSVARDADREVAFLTERFDTVFVGIPLHHLSTLAPFGRDTLTGLLQKHVYSRDLYQMTGAVTDSQRFFGRQTLINEVTDTLRLKGHIGLFGLRKMGKTSFLYRILEKLRAHPSILTAHVDVQRIDAIERSSAYFLWSLGEALFDANKSIQTNGKLRLFGKHSMFLDMPETMRTNIGQFFHHDVRCVLEGTDRRIVFLVDEIERMWPGEGGTTSGWGEAFVTTWRLLRGLEQEFVGSVSFFVTGTSPQCIEASKAAGKENPLYRYIERRFLPQLDDASRKELLTRIGSRIGLTWTEEAITFVVSQVAGHPSLLRSVGSFVHRALVTRTGPMTVDDTLVRRLFQSALPELNASLRQITEALRESYPDDFLLLDLLANGRIGEYRDLARIAPDALVHLRGYELVDVDNERVALEALQTLLQNQHREGRRSQPPPAELEPGKVFEGYTIVQHLSSGGFGAVYKATREDGSVVALKVFLPNKSSFELLQREVDALESISHPSVLSVHEGSTTSDGRVYLVTEFLDGETLERNCTRSSRHRDAEAEGVLKALLDALKSFHPNVEKLEALRAKEELSSEEADEMSRARAGVIHRDITPSNVIVVEGRGPVLIDFGIASKISSPVKTMSAKPGYLPPDFDMTRWSPDVDLYQLGLTILQTRLGATLDGTEERVQELRDLLRSDMQVGTRLRRVVLRMTDPVRGNRFASAQAVEDALAAPVPM